MAPVKRVLSTATSCANQRWRSGSPSESYITDVPAGSLEGLSATDVGADNQPEFGQKRSIKRGSHARGVQRDRLDLDAHDLSLLRFLEHRVERVRLGPAVYRRVDSVRNGSPRVDGSFGHVRIDAQV